MPRDGRASIFAGQYAHTHRIVDNLVERFIRQSVPAPFRGIVAHQALHPNELVRLIGCDCEASVRPALEAEGARLRRATGDAAGPWRMVKTIHPLRKH